MRVLFSNSQFQVHANGTARICAALLAAVLAQNQRAELVRDEPAPDVRAGVFNRNRITHYLALADGQYFRAGSAIYAFCDGACGRIQNAKFFYLTVCKHLFRMADGS